VTKVYVTMGIPGRGKSHATQLFFAGLEDVLIVNPDSIRAMLTGDAADQSQNAEVFKTAHRLFAGGILDPGTKVVVFDATNVQRRSREELLKICAECGVEATLLVFDVDFGLCAQRNYERERTVPLHAMVRLQTDFEKSLEQVASEEWGEVEFMEGGLSKFAENLLL
jgi:predicted kinase